MRYIFLMLMAITLVKCSSSKNIKKEEAFLYYGKTQCLGKCPVFDIYLFKDGKVFYEGFKNVSKLGVHEFSIKTEDVEKIKKELEKIDFTTKEKLTRDFPNTVLKFKGKRLAIQKNDKVKRLIFLLEKIKI
ncbi:DUF6438 domain-containing protein [Tenacibaculum singaporense]|uniref:DUF6438 domain-containing protein n=1 Tax=Tenacibaculum singaporense TaxID=2358479 RepID=UPI000F6860ED|nr:DUF6438 domain-containing protein [Tenacibaculum singaporense]RSC93094.1 hypothetical protein EI424_11710 [Tenacibaculum singaporense]